MARGATGPGESPPLREPVGRHLRLPRRLVLLAASLVLPGSPLFPGLARAATRFEPAGSGVRLVLALSGPGEAPGTVFSLQDPPRLVFDLPGLALRGQPGVAAALPVQRLRHATNRPGVLRIVLDLDQPVTLRRVGIEQEQGGWALVAEILPGSAQGFRALAAGQPVRTAAAGIAPRAASRATPARRATGPAPKPPEPPQPLVVVLDPGHGGKDPGAVGVSGVYEKRLTLGVALELRRRLQARPGVRVHLTRSTDVFVPLAERVRFAQAREADLFVSLHADSAPARSIRGASVYTLGFEASDELAASLAVRENAADRVAGPAFPGVSPEVARILFSLVRRETLNAASELADTMVESLGKAVPMLAQPHRQAGFVVLKAPDIPSVLVELGFLSNREDERKLRDAKHRARLAEALADALFEHAALRPPPPEGATAAITR